MSDFSLILERLAATGKAESEHLTTLLSARGEHFAQLCAKAQEVRMRSVGSWVYLRGLIEMSNLCRKNCLYCGIRAANSSVTRYVLDAESILSAVTFAADNGFGSIALQAGERVGEVYTRRVTDLLQRISSSIKPQLGITLSLGEQPESVLREWKNSGATRYLLRIETSDPKLYRMLHPDNDLHSFSSRLDTLSNLRNLGYIVGTGVMIGLPGQSIEMLAQDLLWLQRQEVDMVGMGPYIPHMDTPLWHKRHEIPRAEERLRLSIAMVACLRLLMPTINIAATTALQVMQSDGRELAIRAGANVIMPNITPECRQNDYALYSHKPLAQENLLDALPHLQRQISLCGCEVQLHTPGDPLHFLNR